MEATCSRPSQARSGSIEMPADADAESDSRTKEVDAGFESALTASTQQPLRARKKTRWPKSDRGRARARHVLTTTLDWNTVTVHEMYWMYRWHRQVLIRSHIFETTRNGRTMLPFLDQSQTAYNPEHPICQYSGLDGFEEFLEAMEKIYAAPKKPRIKLEGEFFRTLSALYREAHPYSRVVPDTMTEAKWGLEVGLISVEEYDQLSTQWHRTS